MLQSFFALGSTDRATLLELIGAHESNVFKSTDVKLEVFACGALALAALRMCTHSIPHVNFSHAAVSTNSVRCVARSPRKCSSIALTLSSDASFDEVRFVAQFSCLLNEPPPCPGWPPLRSLSHAEAFSKFHERSALWKNEAVTGKQGASVGERETKPDIF
jgi:hypothetical protein